MKKTLMFGLLIVCNSVFGQIPGKKMDGPIVIFDTISIKKGDLIYLGKGSDPNSGDYMYITTPKKKLVDVPNKIGIGTHTEYKLIAEGISNNYNGRSFPIKSFSLLTSKNNDDKILGVIQVGASFNGKLDPGIYNQAIDFEAAILAGEIIKINDIDFTKTDSTKELPHFTLTPNGVQPIVFALNGKSKQELYTRTLNWYIVYYKNKNESSITTIENKEVGIVAQKSGVLISKILGTEVFADVEYRFIIEYLDNGIRMNFGFVGDSIQNPDDATQEGYFDEDGQVKKGFQNFKVSVEQMMNEISNSLIDYLSH